MAAKTVAAKLVIKPGNAVWVSHPDRAELLGPLPEGAALTRSPGEADAAVVFADDATSVRAAFAENETALTTRGVLWVAYPKANRTDVNRDTLWPILGDFGLRPVSQVAIDEVWSALRFRPLKAGEEFAGAKARG